MRKEAVALGRRWSREEGGSCAMKENLARGRRRSCTPTNARVGSYWVPGLGPIRYCCALILGSLMCDGSCSCPRRGRIGEEIKDGRRRCWLARNLGEGRRHDAAAKTPSCHQRWLLLPSPAHPTSNFQWRVVVEHGGGADGVRTPPCCQRCLLPVGLGFGLSRVSH
jgi:hypothetical protein